jgi:hypothetical protein
MWCLICCPFIKHSLNEVSSGRVFFPGTDELLFAAFSFFFPFCSFSVYFCACTSTESLVEGPSRYTSASQTPPSCSSLIHTSANFSRHFLKVALTILSGLQVSTTLTLRLSSHISSGALVGDPSSYGSVFLTPPSHRLKSRCSRSPRQALQRPRNRNQRN